MSEFLRWLLLLEIIGVLALPLTFWLFGRLPDRGYGFAKLFGAVLVTYIVWLLGSIAPIAGPVAVPAAVLLAGGAAVWAWRGRTTMAELRSSWRLFAGEEALFIAALAIWSLMRAFVFHPGIGHTEQYMDLTFLQGSLRSVSYPPYDPWMSGHTINYYYFGYLLYATLIKLSGLSPLVGYNLALSAVFAFTISGAFSVAYALIRRVFWALLGPALLALVGNWHAVLVQLPSGHDPNAYYWFWDSTRVVGGNDTINEFPYFSFMLGDLHPHVMALPMTIMVLGIALGLLLWPSTVRFGQDWSIPGRLVIAALACGLLYATNSWDFPTYLVLVAACLLANAYLTDESEGWWRAPAVTIPALAVLSVIAVLPFLLHFGSPTHGIGLVTTPSNLGQFLQVFGLFLLIAALLLITYALVFQPANDNADEFPAAGQSVLEVGSAMVDRVLLAGGIALVVLIVGLRFDQWTLALLVGVAWAGGTLLWRVLNAEEPNHSDIAALIAITLAAVILAGTEVVYLRDGFDGGPNYRMNTVFKFYYQAWTLLALSGAYGVFRAWSLVRKHFDPRLATGLLVLVALGVAASGVYTIEAPQTANGGGTAVSLDGESSLRASHPADVAAIDWLGEHVHGNPVVLAAGNGGDYDPNFAYVAAFSGLPTVMGWAGHEYQWRGNDPVIGRRVQDVTAIYTTRSAARARSLLQAYHVRYVFVGDAERTISGADLSKFGRFMRTAYDRNGTRIYTW